MEYPLRPEQSGPNSPKAPPALTQIQQFVLDCTACLSFNEKLLEAADATNCRGISVFTVRSTLASLDRYGLVYNTSEEGTRKNLYRPTREGIERVTPTLDPWKCSVANDKEPVLSPMVQTALDCAVCLTKNELPVIKSSVATCKELSPNTARYALEKLVSLGYAIRGPRTKGENTYLITKSIPEASDNSTSTACQTPGRLRDAQDSLTDMQQKVLDCLRCQVAKGVRPDRLRVTACTGITGQQVRRATAVLADKHLLDIKENNKPGLRGQGKPQAYQPIDIRAFDSRHNPTCTMQSKELARIYDRLSASRKRLLGCLVCIEGQIQAGTAFPGASQQLLEDCTGMAPRLIKGFVQQLIKEAYADRQTGFTKNSYGSTFLRPTKKGLSLLELHKQINPAFDADCWIDLDNLPNPPIHYRNAIIKCVGCIWTQQAAAGKPPAATTRMISECTGIRQEHLIQTALPPMVADGYFKRNPRRGSIASTYMPTEKLRILFGYAADCKMDIHKTANVEDLLAEIPTETFERRPDDEVMEAFEQFVSKLDDNPAVTLEYSMLSKIKSLYPLLTPEEESFLGIVIQKSPDQEMVRKATHKFICSNVRLAAWMAYSMKFETALTSFEDTMGAALAGITKAVHGFDPLMGVKFSTYAFWLMKYQIQKNTAEYAGVRVEHILNIPVTLWRMREFQKQHGKTPSVIELAAMSRTTVSRMQSILDAYKHCREMHSLDNPVNTRTGKGDTLSRHNVIGSTDSDLAATENIDLFDKARSVMSKSEKDILDEVVVKERVTISAYGRERDWSKHDALGKYHRVLSIIRHPYFGIGNVLSEGMFGWQEEAHCQKQAVRQIVTAHGNNRSLAAICNQCAVQKECAAFATNMSPPVTTGIWGGKSAYEYRDKEDD